MKFITEDYTYSAIFIDESLMIVGGFKNIHYVNRKTMEVTSSIKH